MGKRRDQADARRRCMKQKRFHSNAVTSTLRSRECRERQKLNKRDPLVRLNLWLRESRVTVLSLGLKTPRPEDIYNSIDEKQWRKEIEAAVCDIVEETLALKINATALHRPKKT